jgi:hypothetical protein
MRSPLKVMLAGVLLAATLIVVLVATVAAGSLPRRLRRAHTSRSPKFLPMVTGTIEMLRATALTLVLAGVF